MTDSKKILDSYGTFLKAMQEDTKTLAQELVAEHAYTLDLLYELRVFKECLTLALDGLRKSVDPIVEESVREIIRRLDEVDKNIKGKTFAQNVRKLAEAILAAPFDKYKFDTSWQEDYERVMKPEEWQDEFSKHSFTILFSVNSVSGYANAHCQELGIGASGKSKDDAFKNLRAKINKYLEERLERTQ